MGRGYSGNHPRYSGERYDAKQAYNKDLTASARLHYLENDRHDHDSPHHMSVNQRLDDSFGMGQNTGSAASPMNNRVDRLRERAGKISSETEGQGGYDYENPKVQKLLSKATKVDERSGTKSRDERSGELRGREMDDMMDNRPDSPMNEIDRMGNRILNQSGKAKQAFAEGNLKKMARHQSRAMRMDARDAGRKLRANVKKESPMNACAKDEGGSGCIQEMGGAWRVISNKTDKPWPAKYGSKSKAEAALRGYHAG